MGTYTAGIGTAHIRYFTAVPDYVVICMLFKRYPLEYQLQKKVKKTPTVSLNLKKYQKISFYWADSNANTIPSFSFWSGRQNNSRSCKSKQASCANSDAQMVLGSLVCSCHSAVFSYSRSLDSENSSQRRLRDCYVWRREESHRVHFARPLTQACKPALTDSSSAAKRRAKRRFT